MAYKLSNYKGVGANCDQLHYCSEGNEYTLDAVWEIAIQAYSFLYY